MYNRPCLKTITVLVFIAATTALWAQYAPGIDWKKVETEHFTIIFPAELEKKALQTAGKIEHIYAMDAASYKKVRQSHWPIILTTAGTEANGYVTAGPRRSVWYGTPLAENLAPMPWFDLLGIHETRHMVQFDRLNSRTNRLLYFISGQNGLSTGIAFGIPDWYFEGGAIAAETSFSDSGRGRDPLFYQGMRNIASNTGYSYHKLLNGSYREDLPDHYEYGYFLSSYIRKTYGEESWDTILNKATLLPFPSLGMYWGAKKVSGKSWAGLYRDMTEDLSERWRQERAEVKVIENRVLFTADPGDSVKYEALTVEKEGTILARRLSLSQRASLVRLHPDGREEHLMFMPGYAPVSLKNGIAVWTWSRPSALYADHNWSDLVRVDLSDRKKTVLTRKQRFLMPALSPGAKRIAAVEWKTDMSAEIVIMDSTNGTILKKIPLPEEHFPAYPGWAENGEWLYFTLQGPRGRAIAGLDLESEELHLIKDYAAESVKRVQSWGRYVLYASGLSGLENIMAVDKNTKEEFQVTSRLNGLTNPLIHTAASQPQLLYSEYGEGNSQSLMKQDLDPDNWIAREGSGTQDFLYFAGLPSGGSGNSPVQTPAFDKEDVENFSLARAGFNIHSWGIYGGETFGKSLSLNLQSADIMGTLDWTLGTAFDTEEEELSTYFNMNWKRTYPVISWNNSYSRSEEGEEAIQNLESDLLLSLPVNLSGDLWYHSITPYAGAGIEAHISESPGSETPDIPVQYGLDWIYALPGSYRSLFPAGGLQEQFYFEHNPGQDENYFLSQRAHFFLPGFMPSHSLLLGTAYENKSGYTGGITSFSRGYERDDRDSLLQLKVQYALPLLYPDLALGAFMYIKRLKGAAFYDHTGVYDEFSDREAYRSAGIELNMDFTLFNFTRLPLEMGIRCSWLMEEGDYRVEMMFMGVGI